MAVLRYYQPPDAGTSGQLVFDIGNGHNSGVQQFLDTMLLALRVLTAINERRNPDPTDVEKLRELAPEGEKRPLDELARDVIQLALKKRGKAAREE